MLEPLQCFGSGLWRVCSGSPWRDLPPAFGNWNSPFRRFRRWAKAFDADWLLQDLDQRGATAVIPPKANRTIQREYDAEA